MKKALALLVAMFLCVACIPNTANADVDIATLTQLAEQGHAKAQFNLGCCYAKGDGVRQDKAEAVRWNRKAAEQGNAEAQLNLGFCYEYGDGVRQDKAEAVRWYTKAAEQGNAWAQGSLGVCYEYGEGVRQNKSIAQEWYGKACDNGLQLCCYAYRRLNKRGY